MTRRTFRLRLLALALAAFAVRAAYILIVRRDARVGGDALTYHLGSILLVHGHGFIEPLPFLRGTVEQSASHPPLYLLWLAIPTVFHLDGPVWHMMWSAVLGTGSVAVIALIGNEVAGPRAGLFAGALAAVYPNLWIYDGFILSETSAILAAVLPVLLAYRYMRAPTWRRAAWLGFAVGAAALARAELVLLFPLLVIPVMLRASAVELRERLRWLLVAALAAALPMAPWVTFNLTRFEKPVFLSSGLEPTLLGANCDDTYYGERLAYFSNLCVIAAEGKTKPGDDQSQRNEVSRRIVHNYVSHHEARLPLVVLARWGRVTGLFRPRQQVGFDEHIEGREHATAWAALLSFYAVGILAIVGAAILRRRRATLYPLLIPPLIVLIAVAIALGSSRYRASAEGALVVLAAVAVDAGFARVGRARHVDLSTPGSS